VSTSIYYIKLYEEEIDVTDGEAAVQISRLHIQGKATYNRFALGPTLP
jgi:hypothetical protein